MEIDWVKRKAIGEQLVEQQKDDLWKKLCAALESATGSFNLHYGGAAQGHFEGDRHYRIVVQSKPPYQNAVVDVTFVPPEIRVLSSMSHCKTSKFVLNPNKDAPFRRDDKVQLTTDQVSEAILRCVFFPAESRGAHTPIVTPCRAESTVS